MLRQSLFIAFLAFVWTLLAFGDYMGLVPIPMLGVKFYGADLIIVLLAAATISYGFASLLRTRFALFLLLYICFGLFSMFYGFLVGHEPNAVVGYFRRLFFYAVAFWITWRLLDTPKRMVKFNSLAYVGVIPVVAVSVLRAWRGESWNPQFTEEDMRAVSYVAATVLFVVFYDAMVGIFFGSSGFTITKSIFWLIVVGFTFLISNYRLLWAMPVIGSLGLLWIAWHTLRMRSWRAIGAVILIIAVGLVAVIILRTVQNQTYVLIEQKFTEKVLGFQFVNSFRYFVWRQAWIHFKENWLVGIGLGHRLEHDMLSSIGTWYRRTSTTHNILLEVFYQTGIIGGVLFVSLHASFLIYVWRHLRALPIAWARSTLVWLFTYLSMFVLGLFQPFLTIPSAVVLFYIVLGITARYIYWGRRSKANEDWRFEDRFV